MNAEQFQQLMAQMHRGRKVDPFFSGDAVDWMAWRDHFVVVARINGWGNTRQRREIATAMSGQARLYVASINIGDLGANVQPAEGLLDAYEARFCPAAAGDLARVMLRDARQTEDESVLHWHARARHLYRRAYPAMLPAAVEASQDLRDSYILGLRNDKVRGETWRARPATYELCLTHATNNEASELVLNGRAAAAIKTEPGINAMHRDGNRGGGNGDGGGKWAPSRGSSGGRGEKRVRDKFDGNCNRCKKYGHRASKCWTKLPGDDNRSRPYNASSSSGRRKSGGAGRRSVNSMAAADDADDSAAESQDRDRTADYSSAYGQAYNIGAAANQNKQGN